MKILFCAPFPVPVNDDSYSPGGDRKTDLTIRALLELGHEVCLVNSSCTDPATPLYQSRWVKTTIEQHIIDVYYPPRFSPNRRIGKAMQAFFAPRLGNHSAFEKDIDLVWIYNSYLFEARFALSLFRKKQVNIILQIEDLPLARKRSLLNIKPRLDSYYFQELCDSSAKLFIVNSSIARLIFPDQNKRKTVLFPPIIDPEISKTSHLQGQKFSNNRIKIGYFGALTAEKGVNQLLRVIQKLPDHYELNLFGKGELEQEVQALANKIHNVVYHGYVGGKQLVDKLYEMDILLNPHSDISKMQDGVFPFKMLEYIATGSYVITTPLPDLDGVDLSCITTYNYSDVALVEALLNAPKKYSPAIAAQQVENVMHAASFETAKQTITRQLGSLT